MSDTSGGPPSSDAPTSDWQSYNAPHTCRSGDQQWLADSHWETGPLVRN